MGLQDVLNNYKMMVTCSSRSIVEVGMSLTVILLTLDTVGPVVMLYFLTDDNIVVNSERLTTVLRLQLQL